MATPPLPTNHWPDRLWAVYSIDHPERPTFLLARSRRLALERSRPLRPWLILNARPATPDEIVRWQAAGGGMQALEPADTGDLN